MNISIAVNSIRGFAPEEMPDLQKLINVFNWHSSKNALKNRYYEGKITLDEVNLGIALPDGLRGLEIGCSWGAKTVDVLASRSMFDGFVGMNGSEVEELVRELCAELRKEAKEEADCHNCGHSVWYTREDGEKTWLCTKGQPEESVRVTLPNLLCEEWTRA